MSRKWSFTSESVTEGHPDKMADQISDAILDALLLEDPNSRVACETMVTTGICVVAGSKSVSRSPRAIKQAWRHWWRDTDCGSVKVCLPYEHRQQ